MNAKEYHDILIVLFLAGNMFNKLCNDYEECKGCPFGYGVNRRDIAFAHNVKVADVVCEKCGFYKPDEKFCMGWKDNITKEGHHCVFYMAKEDKA